MQERRSRDLRCIHQAKTRQIRSPSVGAVHRPDYPMYLPSCSCICRPARIRPNCRSSAGNNPERADTASDNGGARSSRTTRSAVFPADPTPTANNASNQPRHNLTSIPTGLQPANPIIWRFARGVRNYCKRVSMLLHTILVKRHLTRPAFTARAPPMLIKSTSASALTSTSWAFGRTRSRATR